MDEQRVSTLSIRGRRWTRRPDQDGESHAARRRLSQLFRGPLPLGIPLSAASQLSVLRRGLPLRRDGASLHAHMKLAVFYGFWLAIALAAIFALVQVSADYQNTVLSLQDFR